MSAQGAVQRPRRGRWTASEREVLPWVLLFLSPWIIGLIVFTVIPMGWSLWLSFTDYDPLTRTGDFIGVENYVDMVGDDEFWTSLYNTVYFTVLYVPLSTILGLILALMLNKVGGVSAGFFRTAFYLPNMTPAVAVGALFLLLLNGQEGIVNQLLRAFGLPAPFWLESPEWVKPGIVLMLLWSIGGTVVIYFAALRNVPVEQYEAARIDGANAWQQFKSITLPHISGAIFFTLIINTVYALQLFTEIYAMFFGQQQSGSAAAQREALFYVIYLFNQAFQSFNFGYGSAMAWLLFVIIVTITVIQIRGSRRFVYYEGG